MRRNMLLVHQLLRRVQNSKGVVSTPESMPVHGAKISFTSEEIQYHVGLCCHRTGFLWGGDFDDTTGVYRTVGSLTWNGHDLVEALASRRWWQFRERARRPAGF